MDGSGTGVLDLGMSILGSLDTLETGPGQRTGQEEQMELSLTVPVIGLDPAPIQMAEILKSRGYVTALMEGNSFKHLGFQTSLSEKFTAEQKASKFAYSDPFMIC